MITVFTRLNASAFVKFFAFPMRRLFERVVFFRNHFFLIVDNGYCKSFLNIM